MTGWAWTAPARPEILSWMMDALGCKHNVSVPPYVRQALFSRSFDNDDLLPKIRKPVLITHCAEELIVKPAAVDQHIAGLAHAQIQMMSNAGHAPFWDMRQPSTSACGRFPKACRGIDTSVEHAACVISDES